MALSKTLILAQQVTSVKERELLVRPLPLEFCIQFYIYIYLDLALVGVIIIFGSLFTRFEVTESASKFDLKVQSNCQTKLSFSKSLIQTVQRTFQTCSNTFFQIFFVLCVQKSFEISNQLLFLLYLTPPRFPASNKILPKVKLTTYAEGGTFYLE